MEAYDDALFALNEIRTILLMSHIKLVSFTSKQKEYQPENSDEPLIINDSIKKKIKIDSIENGGQINMFSSPTDTPLAKTLNMAPYAVNANYSASDNKVRERSFSFEDKNSEVANNSDLENEKFYSIDDKKTIFGEHEEDIMIVKAKDSNSPSIPKKSSKSDNTDSASKSFSNMASSQSLVIIIEDSDRDSFLEDSEFESPISAKVKVGKMDLEMVGKQSYATANGCETTDEKISSLRSKREKYLTNSNTVTKELKKVKEIVSIVLTE